MKFGRLEAYQLSTINWSLPQDSLSTQQLLNQLTQDCHPPSVYIGCSVWTDSSFIGKVYPTGTSTKNLLKAYCQQFNTVELNTTFYSIPSIEKVKRWKSVATPGFKFCPKVAQSISHRSKLDEQRRWLDIFIEAILHFEETLGMTFMQLPPYFQPNNVERLLRLLEQVPQEFSFSIELRHPAWFNDNEAQQTLFNTLKERGIGVVITDTAGRRDVLHQTLTTNAVFIRFVGNNLDQSDYKRIDTWVDKLNQWIRQGLTTIYFLMHEPEKALSADLTQYMIQKLNDAAGLSLAPPKLGEEQVALF